MDQGKKECIEKKLMEYGVLTRRMKEKLIPELTEQCNQTVTEEEVDNLAEDLFKMTCTPEDFETGKSMLELPEGETAQDIDSLLTVFAEKLNLDTKKRGREDDNEEDDEPELKKIREGEGNSIFNFGGSSEEGREATPYLYIILGLAIKDLPSMTYETILRILEGSMKLSEMLSNKDNCVDEFLKSMIDKRILSFFKYYVIGEIALSSNPLTLMTSLMEITLKLLPYAKTALGMTIVSSLGYYIHHYINHYGGQVKDSIVGKLEELKTGLDELDSKSSGEIVEQTNEKIKNSIESIKEVLKEKEIAKDGELTKVVGENMANEKEELKKHIGEFDDTMDMEQLKDKLKKKAEEEQAVPVAEPDEPAEDVEPDEPVKDVEPDEPAEEEDDQLGGKKKKKGGATKKKKTNTKGKKKASKSKKSKTKKARKTRKTRKNKK